MATLSIKKNYKCQVCGAKTTTTNAARAAAQVCVKCRPDLDTASEPELVSVPAENIDAVMDSEPAAIMDVPNADEIAAIVDAEPANDVTLDATTEPETGTAAEAVADAINATPAPFDALVPAIDAPTAVVPSKRKKPSALDAAALVLRESSVPMSAKEIFGAILERNLWASPNGRTPNATIQAAMGREIHALGAASRFLKAERGKFIANPAVA